MVTHARSVQICRCERSFGWMARFRRLDHDYEWLSGNVVGPHLVAFADLMLHRAASLPSQSA